MAGCRTEVFATGAILCGAPLSGIAVETAGATGGIMWQRFTQTSRQAIMNAEQEALGMYGAQVETEHLLLGLLNEEKSSAVQILHNLGISEEKVKAEFAHTGEPALQEQKLPHVEIEELSAQFQVDPVLVRHIESRLLHKLRGQSGKSELKLSEQCKRVLELAADESRQTQRVVNHSSYIGTEHLLLGLLRDKESTAAKMLQALGLDVEQGRAAVIKHLQSKGEEDEPKVT